MRARRGLALLLLAAHVAAQSLPSVVDAQISIGVVPSYSTYAARGEDELTVSRAFCLGIPLFEATSD